MRWLFERLRRRVATVCESGRRLQVHAPESTLTLKLRNRQLGLVNLFVDEVYFSLTLIDVDLGQLAVGLLQGRRNF